MTDHRKAPQQGKNVTVKGDLGQSAAGKTDKNGELTVPEVAVSYTHLSGSGGVPSDLPWESQRRAHSAAKGNQPEAGAFPAAPQWG